MSDIEVLTLSFLFGVDSAGVKATGDSNPARRATLGLANARLNVRDRLWPSRRLDNILTLVVIDYAMRMREFVTLTSAPTASRLLV